MESVSQKSEYKYISPKIITIDVEKFFTYFPKKSVCKETLSCVQTNESAKDEKKMECQEVLFCLDTTNRQNYRQVIKQTSEFDDCPLLDQIRFSDAFKKAGKDCKRDDWLLDILVIMDFGYIFSANFKGKKAGGAAAIRKDATVTQSGLRDEKYLVAQSDLRDKKATVHQSDEKDDDTVNQLKVKDIIEHGFEIKYADHTVVMQPFDKSGNMSRKSRMTFIAADYYDELNERLNLGMDFSNIKVKQSKYYAYRGLYLTSSRRVAPVISEDTLISKDTFISKDTLVVMSDNRRSKSGSRLVLGPAYEKYIKVFTAVPGEKKGRTQEWKYIISEADEGSNNENHQKSNGTEADEKYKKVGRKKVNGPEGEDRVYTETPFDGVGFISEKYAEIINKALGIKGATSFQVRLPFGKGMLHQVDFKGFLEEFDEEGWNSEEPYEFVDAFGITRDLKKAEIIMTESMFKCYDWLNQYFIAAPNSIADQNPNAAQKSIADQNPNAAQNSIADQNPIAAQKYNNDPMQFYCEKFQKYHHALYISGTNLPFGHSEYTHLSYQMINTLDFMEKEFQNVLNRHEEFVKSPESYLGKWNSEEATVQDEIVIDRKEPSWKKALFQDDRFREDIYIAEQLKSTQKGLITKIAKGKIAVAGQTRFLCRDLLPLLALLLKNEKDVSPFWKRSLFERFYMPQENGNGVTSEKYKNLKYSGACAFFRSPHLSRYEECALHAFAKPAADENYIQLKNFPSEEKYREYVDRYNKYFGHLTGVVMVPRGSVVPLCLGGADFDGDLVNVVYDEDVVNAVLRGNYENNKWNRKTPVIKIPEAAADRVTIDGKVPYEHIKYTFSNSIGLLSNAAISAGQTEYGRNEQISAGQTEYGRNEQISAGQSEYGESAQSSAGQSEQIKSKMSHEVDDVLTCAKCTVLTGLEIDAAKNGIHPDLSLLNQVYSEKAFYLQFLEQFKRFSSNSSYDFDKMKFTEGSEEKEGNARANGYFEISEEGCPGTIRVDGSQKYSGTKINQLPFEFKKEYEIYKDTAPIKAQVIHPFKTSGDDCYNREELHKANEFREQCKSAIELYGYYKNVLFPYLKNEKNKKRVGYEHLEQMIYRMYDSENANAILDTLLQSIADKLNEAIGDQSALDVRKRMTVLQWQFTRREKREETLEKIVGNNFKSSSLDEEEKKVLFHFNQQGYKILYYILTYINDLRIISFEEIEKKAEEKKEYYKLFKEEQQLLENGQKTFGGRLRDTLKDYYYNNLVNADKALAQICKEKILDICEIFREELTRQNMIAILYELTDKALYKKSLFWNLFSWDNLAECISKEGE